MTSRARIDWTLGRQLWDRGLPALTIAWRLGCADSTVFNHAADAGWPPRHAGGRRQRIRGGQPRRSVTVTVRCGSRGGRYEAESEGLVGTRCPHCGAAWEASDAA